ncbi:hypothetical protein [Megasphaera vaginalis (ex Srinivasan et al. 2021)]|uniref:Uncharacterized protein n=1 Tax=Megasphaera vaginalis (ex Srinivasan et al. 2021) TaxID=1111454 RepID=U7URP6_9FIRM|nr:hypothetical protein [Megasphaera vaginalis (ex Srinivasan et al. 2021)]ERT62005.1 hypothetical protein HMPREF1250_1976 [Megasphaera vaginalis (ex Srinivasan et al. 2021)]
MSVLDNFVEEILHAEGLLQSKGSKQAFLGRLLRGLEKERPPQFKVPLPKYTFESNLHGLSYDYQKREVTLSYKVASAVYPDVTVSFGTFRVLLEGLSLCIRMQKW